MYRFIFSKFFKKNLFLKKSKRAFSLLELLIVVAIMAIIAAAGSGFYMNYGKNVEIKSLSETMLFDLKQAQSKSMIGEGGLKYGVHFVNATKGYYEIFSTPTVYSDGSKVIISTNYLPSGITFTTPTVGTPIDIIFNKISGGTSPSSVSIASTNNTSTISVSSLGNITIQ